MNRSIWSLAPVFTLAISVTALTACLYVADHQSRAAWEEVATGWIADRADIICGLDDVNQLSNPACIDYHRTLHSTAEMKKMRDNNIDPASPEGILLKSQAADHVRRAAETARVQTAHCSVWKHIRHKDGRTVPDLTIEVLALL